MTCTLMSYLHTAGTSYVLMALGAALGWAAAAVCYASRRSEDAIRAALNTDEPPCGR